MNKSQIHSELMMHPVTRKDFYRYQCRKCWGVILDADPSDVKLWQTCGSLEHVLEQALSKHECKSSESK